MRFIDAKTGLEVLYRDECLALMASCNLGRIGVVDGGRPLVLPVNYALAEERVFFRTAPGSKFDAVVRDAQVAFEVDAADPAYRTGWSVLGGGRSTLVTDQRELARIDELGLRPWADFDKPHLVRIDFEWLSGRRIVTVGEPRDENPDQES